MRALWTSALLLLRLAPTFASSCKVDVPNNGTYDLSGLDQTYSATYNDDSGNTYTLSIAVCGDNAQKCEPSQTTGSNEQGAVAQIDGSGKCNVCCKWDLSAQGTSIAKVDSGFTVTFTNGDTCGNDPRACVYTFTCLPGAETPQITASENPSCIYNVEISTEYACPGAPAPKHHGGSGGSSGGLSGGWIFIIILLCLLVVYCLAGVGWNYRKGERGKDMMPHLPFWCSLFPRYVWAGCQVTKEFCVKMVNKVRGKGGEGYEDVDDSTTN